MTKNNAKLFLILVLVLSTFITYYPSLENGFVWDDEEYILKNPHVISGLTLGNIHWALVSFYSANWHPVTWISHMIDCQVYIELFPLVIT